MQTLCYENLSGMANLQAYQADKCTTERWAHDAAQIARMCLMPSDSFTALSGW